MSFHVSRRAAALAPLALLAATPLFAHVTGDAAHHSHNSFASGLAHPIGGLDHVLAMVAVGLWSAQLAKGASSKWALWALPAAFPVVMALGAALGMAGIGLPLVEVGIALSAVVLGAMVLMEAKPGLWMAGGLVAFFALFHGHAHGAELPAGASALGYAAGFVLATVALHATGIALGLLNKWPAGERALRAGGGLVAAGGAAFLVMAFMG